MLNQGIDDIIKQICKSTGVSEELVLSKIQEKKDTLHDLISDEGAAYIVASELGVNVLSDLPKKKIQIKDALVGMRGINLVGRIIAVFDIREFQSKDKKGKVASFVIGDETGTSRVVLWNEFADQVKKLEKNQVVRVVNAYVKESERGKELHISSRGGVEQVQDESIKLPPATEINAKVKTLAEAEPNDLVSGAGTLVQVYRPSFYSVCSECNSSVSDGSCKNHPTASKKKEMVLSFMLDDGERCTRCVSFRDCAEKLAEVTATDAEKIIIDKNEAALQEHVDTKLLGKQIIVKGKLKFNQSFNRSEILVNNSENCNAQNIIEQIETNKK